MAVEVFLCYFDKADMEKKRYTFRVFSFTDFTLLVIEWIGKKTYTCQLMNRDLKFYEQQKKR